MPILRFATNVPQQVRLESLEPRVVDSQFGGVQHLFTAQEGIFYVSDKVGAILGDQFAKLGVKPGDPIEITKAEVTNGQGRKTQWIVSAQSDADEQPTELERQLADSIAVVEARKQAQQRAAAAPVASVQQPAWAETLAGQTRQLIDVYAAALAYAGEVHGNAIRPDDIRALMTTAFINLSQKGTSRAA